MAASCPKCRTENPPDSKFCRECATPLPDSLKDRTPLTRTLETATDELQRGTLFAARYEIIEELGVGGMGRVYRAHDTQLNEEVALKLIKPEITAERKGVERFRNEIKIARKITHKNVCRTHDLHEEGKRLFLTMEYVRGEDLKSLIHRTKALTAGTAVALARQVAEGLAEAHRLGIVHRDLKPGNIMVDKEGQAKIMDFGIARSLLGGGVTGEGAIIGTPEYMSPEQVEGKPADARSDIYALGVILFEMVVGRPPFEGETPFSIANKHRTEPPPVPKKLLHQLPEDLNQLILNCLEKDKEKRFSNAGELAAELGRIEQALPKTEPVAPERRTHTSEKVTVTFNVKRIAVPAIAAVLVVVAVLGLWLVVLKKDVTVSSTGRPRLAVLYFKNNTGDAALEGWRTALPGLVIADLYQSRYIDVASDSEIYGALKELGLANATAYTPEELSRVAKKTRATHIVQGSLTRAGMNFRISTTLEEVATSKVLNAQMVDGEGEASFHLMVDELGRKIKAGLRLTSREIASDVDRDVGQITSASPEAYRLYAQGLACHMDNDFKTSIALMEKAIAIDPGFAMAYLLLAINYWNSDQAKFLTNIEKAYELRGRVPERERYFLEAQYSHYASEKTWSAALESYDKFMAVPTWDFLRQVAYQDMASLYTKMDEWDKAIERYEALRQHKWQGLGAYQGLAWCYLSKGQPDKARQVLEDYLSNTAEAEFIQANLAIVYCILDDLGRALEAIDRSGTSDLPMSSEARFVYLCNKRDRTALQGLLDEMARVEVVGWDRNYRRIALVSQGRIKEVVADLLSGSKDYLFGWAGWDLEKSAAVLEMTGQLSKALSECEKSRETATKEGDGLAECRALYRQGIILAKQGLLEKAAAAAEELRRTVELSPAKKRARYHEGLLGVISLLRGDPSAARERFHKALSTTSVESGYYFNIRPEILDYLAQSYELSGLWDEAKSSYEEILRLRWVVWEVPSNTLCYVRSHYKLGTVLERMGDKAGAAARFREFLDLWRDADPGLPEVEDAKMRLAAMTR